MAIAVSLIIAIVFSVLGSMLCLKIHDKYLRYKYYILEEDGEASLAILDSVNMKFDRIKYDLKLYKDLVLERGCLSESYGWKRISQQEYNRLRMAQELLR